MKYNIQTISILILVTFFSSCIYYNSFYTKKDLVETPQILGVWCIKTKNKIDTTNIYKISNESKYNYKAIRTCGNIVDETIFTPFKFGGQIYLEVRQLYSNMGKRDTLPLRAIFKYFPINENSFKILSLDNDLIVKDINTGKINLKHKGVRDDIYVTASTKELQIFLKTIVNNKEYWSEEMEYVKMK